MRPAPTGHSSTTDVRPLPSTSESKRATRPPGRPAAVNRRSPMHAAERPRSIATRRRFDQDFVELWRTESAPDSDPTDGGREAAPLSRPSVRANVRSASTSDARNSSGAPMSTTSNALSAVGRQRGRRAAGPDRESPRCLNERRHLEARVLLRAPGARTLRSMRVSARARAPSAAARSPRAADRPHCPSTVAPPSSGSDPHRDRRRSARPAACTQHRVESLGIRCVHGCSSVRELRAALLRARSGRSCPRARAPSTTASNVAAQPDRTASGSSAETMRTFGAGGCRGTLSKSARRHASSVVIVRGARPPARAPRARRPSRTSTRISSSWLSRSSSHVVGRASPNRWRP